MTSGQIIYVVLALFGGLFALIKVYLHDQEKIQKDLADHAGRLLSIEERNKHAPTHEDMGKLHEKMNELNRMQGHMTGVLEGILTTNQMIVKQAMMGEANHG